MPKIYTKTDINRYPIHDKQVFGSDLKEDADEANQT